MPFQGEGGRSGRGGHRAPGPTHAETLWVREELSPGSRRAEAGGGAIPGGPCIHQLRFGGLLSITRAQRRCLFPPTTSLPPPSLPLRLRPGPPSPAYWVTGFSSFLRASLRAPGLTFRVSSALPPCTPGRPQNWTAWAEGPGTREAGWCSGRGGGGRSEAKSIVTPGPPCDFGQRLHPAEPQFPPL